MVNTFNPKHVSVTLSGNEGIAIPCSIDELSDHPLFDQIPDDLMSVCERVCTTV